MYNKFHFGGGVVTVDKFLSKNGQYSLAGWQGLTNSVGAHLEYFP